MEPRKIKLNGVTYVKAEIHETINQVNHAKDEIEKYLKSKTGKSFKLVKPFVYHGEEVTFRFEGKKSKGDLFSPTYYLVVTYEPGPDTYKIRTLHMDGMSKETEGKTIHDMYAEDFETPDKFFSWIKK